MISYLKGEVLSVQDKYLVVNVNNIGFKVFLSPRDIQKVKPNQEIELFTVCVFKREALDIYGFLSPEGKRLFEILNKVSGIGPKAALSITSLGSLREIQEAIKNNNQKFFSQIKGVGKKKIQRVILEMGGNIKQAGSLKETYSEEEKKVLEALVRLGFSRPEVNEVISKIPDNVKGLSSKIRFCLNKLSS